MIHQYKLNGFNVVLDVFSGAVHSVDALAYDIIGLFEACSEEDIVLQMLEKYAETLKSPTRRFWTVFRT